MKVYSKILNELMSEGVLDADDILANLMAWLGEEDIRKFFLSEYNEFDTDPSDGDVNLEEKEVSCENCGSDVYWFMHSCQSNNQYDEMHGCPSCDDYCIFCS